MASPTVLTTGVAAVAVAEFPGPEDASGNGGADAAAAPGAGARAVSFVASMVEGVTSEARNEPDGNGNTSLPNKQLIKCR